jgi:hypothetical protein
MPRPSLPSNLKCLKTYSVFVTQTKEEEVWSHMTSTYARYMEFVDKQMQILNKIQDYLDNENPYAECSWKKNNVEKLYTKDKITNLLCQTEDELNELFFCLNFLGDLKNCNKFLKWETDEEYKDEYNDMQFEIELKIELKKSKIIEIETWDKFRFNQAKDKWTERNKEWIEHQNHTSQNYIESCSLCMKQKERDDINKAKRLEIEQKNKLELELFMQQKKEEEMKKIEKEIVLQVDESKTYFCDMCQFSTKNKYQYEAHINSNEHMREVKMKNLFCEKCGVQSRSEIEYRSHILSKKHNKTNTEAIKYECVKCEYVTEVKQHYETHCKSSKHMVMHSS